jgi:phage-related protein (TIGR01555 family)
MATRHDGWANLATGLGTALRDKRLAAQPSGFFLRQQQAEFLWRSDDMAARVVESVPHDATRRGFNFTIKPNANAEELGQQQNPDAIDGLPPLDLFSQLEPPELEQRRLGAELGQRFDEATFPKLTRADQDRILGAWARGQLRRLATQIRRDEAAVPVDPTMATEKQGDANETKEQQEAVMAAHRRLGTVHAVRKAGEFERAYGGAAIFLGTVDTSTGRSPSLMMRALDLNAVQELRFLTVLTPLEIVPYRYYGDPLAPKFGEVQIWTMVPKSKGVSPRGSVIRIHESRLILFKGIRTSRFMVETHRGFGDSVLNRTAEHIRNFSTSFDAAAVLVHDFAQAVYKMKGLVELLHADGAGLVKKRAEVQEYTRSVLNAMLIDADEEFERKTTNVTGLPDLLDRMANRLAAATDMPVTKLMGQAPAGLNATGKADRDWYNENLAKWQEDRARPAIERITDVEIHATDGALDGRVPDGWEVVFPPMEEPDEETQSKIRLNNAQADVAYIGAGVLHPEEIASSRFGGSSYGTEITLSDQIRDAAKDLLDVKAERAEDLHEQQINPPADPAAPPFAKKDEAGDDDEPRDEGGKWTAGGGGGSMSAADHRKALKEADTQAKMYQRSGLPKLAEKHEAVVAEHRKALNDLAPPGRPEAGGKTVKEALAHLRAEHMVDAAPEHGFAEASTKEIAHGLGIQREHALLLMQHAAKSGLVSRRGREFADMQKVTGEEAGGRGHQIWQLSNSKKID